MFLNCPACGFLVALDHSGQPLARCPNCAQRLRGEPPAAVPPEPEPLSAEASPAAQAAAPAAGPETPAASDSAPGEADDAHAQAHPEPESMAPARTEPDPADPEQAPAAGGAGVPGEVPAEPVVEAPAAGEAEPGAEAQGPPPPASDDRAIPAHVATPDFSALGLPESTVEAAGGHPPPAEAGSTDKMEAAARSEVATSNETSTPLPSEATPVAPATAAVRIRKSRAVPSFARNKPRAASVDRRGLLLRCSAIAALSLLLALQLLLSDRAHLAADPGWRPLLSSLCTMLHCTLPPWREPRAFHVIERDVRARQAGVLRVSARIRNDARWPQPWPALQLTFSDANGRELATRVFAPREYLGGQPPQPLLGNGQSAALAMDIIEPGPQAVAFTFDFK